MKETVRDIRNQQEVGGLAPGSNTTQNVDIPSLIKLIDNKTNAELVVKPIDQKTGREKLAKLLKSEITIEEIDPIFLASIKGEGKTRLRLHDHNSATINLKPEAYKAYEKYGALLALAQKDKRFGYQWLDFYPVEQDGTVDLNKKLDSVRVNTDTGKFENRGWYGPEQQAFLDYLSGSLSIENPSNLPTFTTKIIRFKNNRQGIYLGRVKGQNLALDFRRSLQVDSSEIIIMSKYDPQRKYFWIEGYDVDDPENSHALFVKKIILDDSGRIKIANWNGPRIEWAAVTPEERITLIEKRITEFIAQGNVLNQITLKKSGMGDLVSAINKYYPNGLTGLKMRFGLEIDRHSKGYWTPEQIEKEAIYFYRNEGTLTQQLLAKKGRRDLLSAIYKFYPGGIVQLKVNLELELAERPKGYWNPEKIEEEARGFLEQEGGLTQRLLVSRGRPELKSAISRNYPGGIYALEQKLGLAIKQQLPGYWTPEQIEKEAKEVFEEEGALTQKVLYRKGKAGLAGAIKRHYPGGLTGLKEKLGISIPNNEDTISPEEANERLMKLLEAKD